MKLFTKLTLSLAVFFCLSSLVSAQTVNKGAWMIGGSAGFSSSKVKDADKSSTNYFIAPDLGYYFANDLAIGLNVSLEGNSFDGNSTTTTSLGPWVRYYVTHPIFVTVGAGFGLSEPHSTNILGGVGYSWFLNSAVAIEPEVYFLSHTTEGDVDNYTQFGLQIGVQAFIGRTTE